jgi:hypothetical protein
MATWEMRPDSRPCKMPRGENNMRDATDSQGAPIMKVLVAFEDLRSLYRDILVKAIRDHRPTLTVRSASLDGLEHELKHFDPHVVVCSLPNGTHPAGSGAWVHIPTGDEKEMTSGWPRSAWKGSAGSRTGRRSPSCLRS